MTDAPRHRVTHVINRFGFSGGAENQLLMNLSHFTDPGIEHTVLALYHDNDDEDDLVDVPKTFLFPRGARPSRITIIRRVRQELKRTQPSLVHCSLAEAALAARIVGMIDKIPVVESLVNISHDPVRVLDNPAVRPWKLRSHRALDRVTMRGVTHFHALTQAVADSWVRFVHLDRSKITVIPRGVDLGRFDLTHAADTRARIRTELGFDDDDRVILNVARQEPQKGQRYLVEAMPRILAKEPNAVLLMVGRRGNSSTQLDELITELGLEDNVRRVGVRADVADVLQACDVFAFPSLFEGLGVSLIEAMAARRPCVTSTAPPFPEIVEHGVTGLLATPADPDDLADNLLAVLGDPDLAERLATAARARVEAHYDIATVTTRIEGLYRSLLES
jgi:glycosyltransferase involved in cell wall biosynthesis